MKIAVTGATGFVGRHLVPYLLQQGHTARCWYRPTSDREGMPRDGIDWVEGELNDEPATEALVEGCDAVIHSALSRSGRSFRESGADLTGFAERNVLGSLRLMQSARQAGVRRFVLISTCAVHERILDDRPLDEAHPTWPLTHYGASKAALEMFVHSLGWGDGWNISALRPTGIYGVAQPVANSKWFELVMRIVNNEKVVCQRGGKEVHVLDVARAAEILLHCEAVAGECFNCYDRYVSEYEVANFAREYAGSSSEIDGETTRPKHQIETDKLRQLGMTFGGTDRLRATIAELVDVARRRVDP